MSDLPRLVPLLPSTAVRETARHAAGPATAVSLPRRKEAVPRACNRCRAKKTKCNGATPCPGCVKVDVECVYRDLDNASTQIANLKRKFSAAEEAGAGFRRLYELVRDRPHAEAMAIVDSIRSGDNPEDIVRRADSGDGPPQVSVLPEARFRYEFSFCGEMPAVLMRSRSRYLRPFLREPPSRNAGAAPGDDARPPSGPASSPSSSLTDRHTKPFSAVTLVEPLLTDADIARWTPVPSSPDLLQRLMRIYLVHAWPVFTHFHKSLFLRDLRAGRHRFCSPLLVNVVLAAACRVAPTRPQRSEHGDPAGLGGAFLAEARRLLELEAGRDHLTTVQALLIFSQAINEQCIDDVSYGYLVQAVDMAKRMGLLGPADKALSPEWRVAREFMAWAIFSWQAIVSYVKEVPPLLVTTPQTPIPEPGQDSAWYDEVWIQYPLNPEVVPLLFPATYQAQLRLRIILKDMAVTLTSVGPGERPSLHQRTRLYARLVAWHEELPPPLQAERITLPSQLGLHLQYWALITSLFEDLDPADRAGLRLQGQTVEEIVREAQCNFEILVRVYYLRHGFDMCNTQAFFFLTNPCFIAEGELKAGEPEGEDADTARSTLILAPKSISNHGRCYYLPEAMLRTNCKQMDPRDVEILKQHASSQGIDDLQVTAEQVREAAGKAPGKDERPLTEEAEKEGYDDDDDNDDGDYDDDDGNDEAEAN